MDAKIGCCLGPFELIQEIVKIKSTVKAMMLSGAVAFGLGVSPVSAQHEHGDHDHGVHEHGEEAGHSHERVEGHGGAVTMSKEFHVETVFTADQVRLYLYDGAQNPIHVKRGKTGMVEATATVDYRDRGCGTTTLKFVRGAPGGYAWPICGQLRPRPRKNRRSSLEQVPLIRLATVSGCTPR